MEGLSRYPDKYFELAIVDPPYGWGVNLKGRNVNGNAGEWNIKPSDSYFVELFRVSKHQIIWGGNYFGLPAHRHFIIWDKKQPIENFARCEFAWSSMEKNASVFEYAYYGNINSEVDRFHPTQKPVPLYKWILKNYAKDGDKILDTHMGSQSSRIAAWDMGFDYYGFEIDSDYFKAGCERFENVKAQLNLFQPK
jgi:site-specific DNA-methyltransferase (adenine-specific)